MKWLGALLIVAASYFCGGFLAHGEKERVQSLESMTALLKYMRRRISAERAPLYNIFASFSDARLEETGFLAIMRSRTGELNSLWKSALETLCLDGEAEAELLRFGEDMGRLPLDEQEKRIDICLDMLYTERDKIRAGLPAKQKSKKTVCVLAGLLAAILLL